jgi:hypothetical protein
MYVSCDRLAVQCCYVSVFPPTRPTMPNCYQQRICRFQILPITLVLTFKHLNGYRAPDAWHPCRYAASGEEVKWFKASKRLTFSAACRAAIGDVLSTEELDELFPLATTMGQGIFSPV